MIRIEMVSESNANDIYDFETENRAYFEETLPSRGEDYFKKEVFYEIIKEIVEEQNRDECYMYIIRNEIGAMVGRVNLYSVKNEGIRSAELGYRIGKKEKGKGYATEAVRLALEKAFIDYKIDKVVAGTSPVNFGSQRVLEKNGFLVVGKASNDVNVNGKFAGSLIFEKNNKN